MDFDAHWIGLALTTSGLIAAGGKIWGVLTEKVEHAVEKSNSLSLDLAKKTDALAVELAKKTDGMAIELAARTLSMAQTLEAKTLALATDIEAKSMESQRELDKRVAELNKDIDKKADLAHTNDSLNLIREGQVRQESKLDQVLVLLATNHNKKDT